MDQPISPSPEQLARLEALLFSYGEPLPFARIAKFIGADVAAAEALITAWQKMLADAPERGLSLIAHNGAVQLVTKPSLKDVAQAMLQDELREELSPAALETLSLIAYLGPVPRATVDYIRGVNSSFSVRNLLVRGLVERRTAEKGNMYEYFPSFQFLKHMGFSRVEELPEYERFHTALTRLETSPMAAPEVSAAPADAFSAAENIVSTP